MKSIFLNWKTTVIGVLGAIAAAMLPVLESGQTDSKSLGMAAVIGLVGVLAKDGDR
ncbi:hypothetical protein [Desulfuromonas thiophila]|uniref:hypothetical protein n=1 Tax=Desulfuromonas thiophila TaxID=57664 RepID=UPI0024A93747|nr:hypothetical protein [Desulfuromonas thiophila]